MTAPPAARVRNVLFLCTGNSARSIMAEALLNHRGAGRYRAFSAGSRPLGRVHPLALELLRSRRLATTGLRSKSWDEFAGAEAPALDIVVTVCDAAAGAVCPVWPGRPVKAHWSLPDPAAFDGPEAAKRETFDRAFREIEARIEALSALPVETLIPADLQRELARLAPAPAASAD
jgi:arsenate reductase